MFAQCVFTTISRCYCDRRYKISIPSFNNHSPHFINLTWYLQQFAQNNCFVHWPISSLRQRQQHWFKPSILVLSFPTLYRHTMLEYQLSLSLCDYVTLNSWLSNAALRGGIYWVLMSYLLHSPPS